MTEITRNFTNLTAATRYIVRVRAVNGLGVKSEWAEALEFSTGSDDTTPLPPTSGTVDFESETLFISWTEPTQNTDGSALDDLSRYEVKIKATGGTDEKSYQTFAPNFVYTLNQNVLDFGTPQPSLDLRIRAIDISGNRSAYITVTAANPVPETPTNAPVLFPGYALIYVQMTPPTGTPDLAGYELYESSSISGPFTLVASTFGDAYPHDVTGGTTHYYKYKARDNFGQVSADFSPTASATAKIAVEDDGTAPANVVGLAGNDGIDPQTQMPYIDATWTANTESDLSHYELRIRKVGDTRYRSYYKGLDFTTHRFPDLHPGVDYQIQIRACDQASNEGNWSPVSPLIVPTDIGTVGFDPNNAGSLIIDADGEVRSSDFVTGVSGWRISGNSTPQAEFSDVMVRGEINATSGSFSGNITSSATITGGVLTGGDLRVPNGSGGYFFRAAPSIPGGNIFAGANIIVGATYSGGVYAASNALNTPDYDWGMQFNHVGSNYHVYIQGNLTDSARTVGFFNTNGDIHQLFIDYDSGATRTISVTSVIVSSDERFKRDVKPLNTKRGDAVEKVKRISPVRYKREGETRERLGFTAQDLQAVFPEVVHENVSPYMKRAGTRPDGSTIFEPDETKSGLGVAYQDLIPVLFDAIKDLEVRLAALESKK